MTEHKDQPVTPSINIYAHHGAGLVCTSFSPNNHMGVTLELNRQCITVYDLPVEKALALAMLFADAYTAVHLGARTLVKLLDHMADPDRTGPLAGFPAPTPAASVSPDRHDQAQED